MPACARGVGQICPTTLVIFTHRLGHSYPSSWSCVPVYVVTDTRVHGYGCSCTRVENDVDF